MPLGGADRRLREISGAVRAAAPRVRTKRRRDRECGAGTAGKGTGWEKPGSAEAWKAARALASKSAEIFRLACPPGMLPRFGPAARRPRGPPFHPTADNAS